jgi:hypothetical protein
MEDIKQTENLVEVSSQEAYELFKYWERNSIQAYYENELSLAKEFDKKSDKWLDIAIKLSRSKK